MFANSANIYPAQRALTLSVLLLLTALLVCLWPLALPRVLGELWP